MVGHVLLDADGVLQRHPVGWVEAAAAYVGDDAATFFADVTAHERDLLAGGDGFAAVLAAVLEKYGVAASADEVYRAVWLTIEPVAGTVALVHRLRGLGLGVHLATNQQAGRAAHMRAELGYDDLFDESFYSCEIGAAKPDPAFFGAALDRLGVPAPAVLFVDDSAANVTAAREVGLAAECWHLDEGMDVLGERLAAHGVLV
ncbi:putative hydrolase of the HAD superfamily [Nocardioides ginsengisegetis]|uniref:Putative hydrolase of the HAD superfamily n=1 Tax=Nocardioides ginsengisegetis TaxID=661491 RepID=A0A7W3J1U2_9ACTN|nr:putative hydrolase of the HAD superfamily [Nocardioides ginsengisegetis]